MAYAGAPSRQITPTLQLVVADAEHELLYDPATRDEDLTSIHNDRWRNWTGDEACLPAAIERPTSVEQLVDAIGQAAATGARAGAGAKVRVAGSGHSFSDIVCTEGTLLSLRSLSRVLDVDRASGLVRVEAGIAIRELNIALARQGLAIENLGDIDSQSLAGAISTATHGTGARLRNLSSQVVALTLLLADGSTLQCSRERDPELFRAAAVGLGALGVIVEVTLRCVPAFTLEGVDATAPLEATLERFEELSLQNDHFELYAFPYAKRVLTRTNNRTTQPAKPPSRAAACGNDILLNNHAFGLLCRLGRRVPSRIPQINRLVTRLAGNRIRVDRSDRIFVSPRLVRFTEMEYSLPRRRTVEAVAAVISMIERERLAVPFPIEVRSVAGDDALLSTANGRDSGYVAVHMFEGMQWRPYFEAVEEIMTGLGGRPHWGKRHFQTAAMLRERYPDWDRFAAVRARLDPDGLFANAWTDRVLGPIAATSGGRGGGTPGRAEEARR